MAKLYYKYGTMNSGKSIDILKTQHAYTEQNKKTLLMTSVMDDRYGRGKVASRIGVSSDAIIINQDMDLYKLVENELEKGDVYAILIDESQFLSQDNIYQLGLIVDELDVPVIAYGLKNDFSNNLFEGSKYLLLYADVIEEIKSICKYCNKKATMNVRLKDGKPVYEGEQVEIGGNEKYESVCRYHYYRIPTRKGL